MWRFLYYEALVLVPRIRLSVATAGSRRSGIHDGILLKGLPNIGQLTITSFFFR